MHINSPFISIGYSDTCISPEWQSAIDHLQPTIRWAFLARPRNAIAKPCPQMNKSPRRPVIPGAMSVTVN